MDVRCYRHPNKEALYECASCGRLICEDCMVFTEGDSDVLCPACSMDTAGGIVMEEEEEKSRQRRAGRKQREAFSVGENKVSLLNPVFLIVFVFLALASYGLSIFLDNGLKPVNLSNPEFARFRNPAIEMVVLTSKLFAYRAENDGVFPKRLGKLFPDYIDRQPTVLYSGLSYDYRKDVKNGFILSCPNPTKYKFRKLLMRENGLIEVK